MKTLLALLAFAALTPLAVRAQSSDPAHAETERQIRSAAAADKFNREEAERAAATQASGPPQPLFRRPQYGKMFTGKTKQEREQRRQGKANQRAYDADTKAHDGWKGPAGGARTKNGHLKGPDGTVYW